MRAVSRGIGMGLVFLGLLLTWPIWAGALIWFIVKQHDD